MSFKTFLFGEANTVKNDIEVVTGSAAKELEKVASEVKAKIESIETQALNEVKSIETTIASTVRTLESLIPQLSAEIANKNAALQTAQDALNKLKALTAPAPFVQP